MTGSELNTRFLGAPCSVATLLLIFGYALCGGAAAQTVRSIQQQPISFSRDIRPILADRCFKCHGPDPGNRMADLRLDLEDDAKAYVIAAGNSQESEFFLRITESDPDFRMPPAESNKTLSEHEIELLKRWIDQGANYEPHWAFSPLQSVEPPEVENAAWVRNPIDRFVLHRLEDAGLAPAAEASREVLARRLSFALTGLPPAPEAIDAMVTNDSPAAYDEYVAELLGSPHYGERWARHWLDVVRYADSEGYENDLEKPLLYRYRDWVIRSLNDDLPYDTFLRFQIAGDEYQPDNPDALVATGFMSAGPRVVPHASDTEENKERYFYDELDDIVKTLGEGVLGLTVGCARCHDHKFDPIPSREYYEMAATFGTYERREAPLSQAKRDLELWLETKREQLRIEKMDKVRTPSYERMLLLGLFRRDNASQVTSHTEWDPRLDFTEQEFLQWLGESGRAELARLQARAEGAPEDEAWIVLDRQATPLRKHYLLRGDVNKKAASVAFGFLSALPGDKSAAQYHDEVLRTAPEYPRTTFQRRALAEWLVDVEHGAGALTARVLVNRLWQKLFGEGIVRTPNDFGYQGDPPTHPELLDWLSGELIRNGWRIKPIQQLIVESSTYRMGTSSDPSMAAIDPNNSLFWRRRPIRLEAEILRDNILAVAGSLNPTMYGPGVRPVIPPEAISTKAKDRWPRGIEDGPENWVRSIYLFRKRSVRVPLFDVFDAPDELASCGRRVTTTVPTQALALINNEQVRTQAEIFAARVQREAGDEVGAQIERAYRLALGRSPSASEQEVAERFLGADETSLSDYCHALLTLNEFMYID